MKIIAVKVFQPKRLRRRNLKKTLVLNWNRTHDLCDTGAALQPTELSSQLGVFVFIPYVDGE